MNTELKEGIRVYILPLKKEGTIVNVISNTSVGKFDVSIDGNRKNIQQFSRSDLKRID